MEATEIQEFAKQVKEGGEESLTSISLAISILAVLVAMVTVLGHRSHTNAVLAQARATDQWNLYEAKKIREDSLEVVLDQMKLQPTMDVKATQAKAAEYSAHIAKWNRDLSETQKKAEDFQHDVEHAEKQAGRFDLGEALLQISVVLCSITLFTRRRTWFFSGVSLGTIGVLIAVSAFLV
jgi:hypothetical protein